jgi:hypothetical protein
VRHFDGFQQVAFSHQFEPVRDIVVNRALPFTVRVAALDTALGLLGGFLLFVVAVYFAKFLNPHECRFFTGVGTLYFQELENVRHKSMRIDGI